MRRRLVTGLALVMGLLLIAVGVQAASQSTNVPSVADFTDQACLDCHTDEARLRELAPEPEDEDVEEAPSEGPG